MANTMGRKEVRRQYVGSSYAAEAVKASDRLNSCEFSYVK